VARRFQRANPHRSHLHFKAVGQTHMREFRVGLRSYIDLRARARCQLFVPGNKVGVQMSFEDVSDSKILLFGRLQIDVHIALRINYRRLASDPTM